MVPSTLSPSRCIDGFVGSSSATPSTTCQCHRNVSSRKTSRWYRMNGSPLRAMVKKWTARSALRISRRRRRLSGCNATIVRGPHPSGGRSEGLARCPAKAAERRFAFEEMKSGLHVVPSRNWVRSPRAIFGERSADRPDEIRMLTSRRALHRKATLALVRSPRRPFWLTACRGVWLSGFKPLSTGHLPAATSSALRAPRP